MSIPVTCLANSANLIKIDPVPHATSRTLSLLSTSITVRILSNVSSIDGADFYTSNGILLTRQLMVFRYCLKTGNQQSRFYVFVYGQH
jgi:hypothetical protein